MTDTRKALEEAWETIHHAGYSPENERDTCRRCDRFTRLLDAEAYLDAAVMLVPEGYQWKFDSHYGLAGVFDYYVDPQEGPSCSEYNGEHSIPALALLAAILKTKENPDE